MITIKMKRFTIPLLTSKQAAVPFKTKEETIGKVGNWLEAHPDAIATVTASTDTVGKPEYNQDLSERRAQAVHGPAN